jgi:hypothetical protein
MWYYVYARGYNTATIGENEVLPTDAATRL